MTEELKLDFEVNIDRGCLVIETTHEGDSCGIFMIPAYEIEGVSYVQGGIIKITRKIADPQVGQEREKFIHLTSEEDALAKSKEIVTLIKGFLEGRERFKSNPNLPPS